MGVGGAYESSVLGRWGGGTLMKACSYQKRCELQNLCGALLVLLSQMPLLVEQIEAERFCLRTSLTSSTLFAVGEAHPGSTVSLALLGCLICCDVFHCTG